MAKIKYYYDTETCRYERVKVTPMDITLNALGILVLCLILSALFAFIYVTYFPSRAQAALIKENEDLKYQYGLLNQQLGEIQQMVAVLQERDDNIYRVIFETSPIPAEIRKAGTGGSQRYQALLEAKLSREDLILDTYKKIDQLKRQMYVQTTSYDQVVELARNKAQMLTSIPAIQPVDNQDLKKLASGFGMRIHPIYKVMKMHTGVDFTAPKGTPVYATGDGKVVEVKRELGGYGMYIVIDHGYGYQTLYGHLSDFEVRLGQKVKRGQEIGKVGNTGTSVAPHLHYEVVHNGKKVNPVNYFYSDITPEQYSKLLELASVENQALGF